MLASTLCLVLALSSCAHARVAMEAGVTSFERASWTKGSRVDQSDIQNYLEGAERRVMIQHAMALAAQRHLPRLRPLNPG